MRNRTLLLLLTLLSITVRAQEVQWADKVIDFSSERMIKFNNHQYRAEQVLGKPDVLPAIQKTACAWSPLEANSPEEYIKVGFSKPTQVRQVVVAENWNAGAIAQVYLYDRYNKAYIIYRNNNLAKVKGRMFRITIPKTLYKVAAVKVVLKPNKVPGHNYIDAIGISESAQPIKATINLGKGLDAKSQPEKLSAAINSSSTEIVPIISPDGKTLYFTRDGHPRNIRDTATREYKQDVWSANIREDKTFEAARNLGAPVNTNGHNACFSISADGQTMLLNNKYLPKRLIKGISISRKVGNSWGQPQALNVEGFENLGDYSAYYLSQDGKTLLLSIQMDDSYGANDLYVSFHQGGNNWSRPRNLGKVVNTAESDTSPFLASDGTTLYYSTMGLSGYGKNDIFVTRRLDDTWQNWSEPQNLGTEINTSNWDAYFTISASGEYAYYTSHSDIYRVKLSEVNKPEPVALVQGVVYNKKSSLPLNARIIIEKLPEATKAANGNTNSESGEYKNILNLGSSYRITAEAKGFFPASESIDLSDQKEYTEIEKDFYLIPLEKGATLRLDYIYFGRGSAALLPDSYPELNKLVEMMDENPEVEIRLEGHTEIYGNKKSLTKLSEDRVLSVKNYLVGQGVDQRRIKYKGYGPIRPITVKGSEEERQLNRRVEVKIL